MDETYDEIPDGVTLLKNQHRRMVELFTEIESGALDAAQKKALFEQLSTWLSEHAVAEEEVLYPLVRRTLDDGDAVADHALDEHQEVKETLARLEKMSVDNLDFDGELRALLSSVREHVKEEERDLLARLAKELDADALAKLGRNLIHAERVAPTRPHPHAPNTPPMNVLAGAGAAIVDRVRDHLGERNTLPPETT